MEVASNVCVSAACQVDFERHKVATVFCEKILFPNFLLCHTGLEIVDANVNGKRIFVSYFPIGHDRGGAEGFLGAGFLMLGSIFTLYHYIAAQMVIATVDELLWADTAMPFNVFPLYFVQSTTIGTLNWALWALADVLVLYFFI